MGVKERHEREREAVSRQILDAARELFVTHGYQEVSIRKIAERIEYSPAAIYGYFPSKDDIFFALAEEGFRLLSSYAGRPAKADDPLDELRSTFTRFFEFSRAYPEYYALMFLDRTVPRIRSDWERFEFVNELKRDVLARIQRAIDSGACPSGTPPQAVFWILLTAIHGAATLCLCDRLARGEDGEAVARATLESALAGIRAGAALSFPAASCPVEGAHRPPDSVRPNRHDS